MSVSAEPKSLRFFIIKKKHFQNTIINVSNEAGCTLAATHIKRQSTDFHRVAFFSVVSGCCYAQRLTVSFNTSRAKSGAYVSFLQCHIESDVFGTECYAVIRASHRANLRCIRNGVCAMPRGMQIVLSRRGNRK